MDPDAVWGGEWSRSRMGVLDGLVIVEGKGQFNFGGEFGAFHCNQWDLCNALFSNYFEDLFSILPIHSVYSHIHHE